MSISRMSMVTLGVADLKRATEFYRAVFDVAPNTKNGGVTFIELPGTWLALYPLENLARDISPSMSSVRGAFSGITLAYNARSKEEIDKLFVKLKNAGARIAKSPHDTFWGGYSGYFADLDDYYWEIAWGPMFDFAADGALRFKA